MRTLLAVLVLLLGSMATALAAPSDSERATLTELGSFLVLVKVDGDGGEKAIDSGAVKKDLESRLRLAGLTVHDSVPEAREKSKSDVAVLVAAVDVAPVPEQAGRFVYDVDLQVKQMSTLLRDPERRSLAVTWSSSTVGEGTAAAIDAAVKRLSDTFLSDYRAVNPKP